MATPEVTREAVWSFDLAVDTVRELNARASWRRRLRVGVVVRNPGGRHAIAVGLDAPYEVEIEGHVGYYCAGMNQLATVRVRGNCGVGVAENMMSGMVLVEGSASQSAGATARGGLLVIHGDASARCGISLKGADIVVRGSVGHMSAFMAQRGCLVVCGDAGESLGDSLYEARLYVRGSVAGLGADCVEKEMRSEHVCPAGCAPGRGPGSTTSTRASSGGTARRAGCTTSTSTTWGRTDMDAGSTGSNGWHPGLRESATFDRGMIAEIQRAAREGMYDIRGFGAKRHVPHFDDLAVPGRLGVTVSARGVPGEVRHRRGHRDAFRARARAARHSDHDRRHELRRAVGAGEGGSRPRRHRGGDVDDDRRRRDDPGGARALFRVGVPVAAFPLRHEPR